MQRMHNMHVRVNVKYFEQETWLLMQIKAKILALRITKVKVND